MKKGNRLFVILAILLSFFLLALSGCGSSQLSADFNKEELQTKAEEVIGLLSQKDAQALRELGTVQMKEALTDERCQKIFESLAEGGQFKQILDVSMAGQKDKKTEEEYAVLVIKAKYELKNIIYTMSFTKQMKLAGLYYK